MTMARRLIDADALDSVVLRLNTQENAQITRSEYKLIDSVIFEFPTVDAVPVRRGKWREYQTADGMNQCSECGVLRFGKSNYCPNCGARMDKE